MSTKYSKELGEKICDDLAKGISLIKICRELKINYSTIFRWLKEYPEFEEIYIGARQVQADNHNDKINEIIEDMFAGRIDSNKARVAIDALKWQAGKQKPKTYGDKLDINQSGEVKINIIDYKDVKIDE